MTTNRQNENRVGKVIHRNVGVKIAQTNLLPAIENLTEKELILIQDWIKTTLDLVFFSLYRDGGWRTHLDRRTVTVL